MRELILSYFAIGCLAFARGAPTVEESQVYTKNFTFDKKSETIFSLKGFWKDELVWANCEGSDADKRCKVYVESNNLNQSTVQSCALNLTYTDRFDFSVVLHNVGNSRAVFAVRDGPTKVKLISVNLKDCQIKEASVDRLVQAKRSLFNAIVVPREEDYDAVFQNQQLCQGFLCKATFDYEGRTIKAASRFPSRDRDFHLHQVIKYANNAYLVGEHHDESINVTLVHDKDDKPAHTLYSGAPYSAVGFSIEENKLGYCVRAKQKLICKQYDAEGKSKIIEAEITVGKVNADFLDVHNLGKGLLAVMVRSSDEKTMISVVRLDEQGKQAKLVNVDMKCNRKKILLPNLYKNSNGQYCVSSICFTAINDREKNPDFFRSTRCFFNTELF